MEGVKRRRWEGERGRRGVDRREMREGGRGNGEGRGKRSSKERKKGEGEGQKVGGRERGEV